MNKREYAEFHKYLAILIYEYNEIFNCNTLTNENREEVGEILEALAKVMKICIIEDKEQEEYTLTPDENGTTQINGVWYRVDKK